MQVLKTGQIDLTQFGVDPSKCKHYKFLLTYRELSIFHPRGGNMSGLGNKIKCGRAKYNCEKHNTSETSNILMANWILLIKLLPIYSISLTMIL